MDNFIDSIYRKVPAFTIFGPQSSSSIFPTTDEKSLATLYPSNLKLQLVCFIHRHGHRTPVRYRLHGMMPYVWPHCFHEEPLVRLLSSDSPFKGVIYSLNGTLIGMLD
jgi:hypothetical protein